MDISWVKLPFFMLFAVFLAHSEEVKIELFGQSCILQGPFTKEVLVEVHSISPGEVPLLTSRSSAKTIVDLMEKSKKIPKKMSLYQSKALERAQKGFEFYDALEKFQKKKQADALQSFSKKYLSSEDQKKVTSYLDPKEKQNAEEIVKITSKVLGDAPEAEFHKALRGMKTEYLCNFDHEE